MSAPVWRVVLPDSAPDTLRMLEESGDLDRLRALGTVSAHADRPADARVFGARVGEADAVLLAWDFPPEAFAGAGASSFVDLDLARRHGVRVLTAPGYGDTSVAEHALALTLALLRRVAPADALVRGGGWAMEAMGRDLAGARVGLVGWGGVARAYARLLAGFGVSLTAWSRSRPPGTREGAVRFADLDEVVEGADVLSLHLALTEETRGLLSAGRLARMRPGAVLVNTARGALVDEAALCALLQSGHLSGAALDVFAEEPLAAASPLRRAPNLLMTPHIAYRTPQARRRLYAMSVDNLIAAHGARDGGG